MTTNLTKQTLRRGASPTAIWSVTVGMPGVSSSAYCQDSMPANLSFDGIRLGHRAAETSPNDGSRQLQL
jgi:hypothetical protein